MPLWLSPPLPWPDAVEEALALPEIYGINAELVRGLIASKPEAEQREWVRAYVAFCWNSYLAPRWFNALLFQAVLLLLLVGVLRRLVTPSFIRRLPAPLRQIYTFTVKHLQLAPVFGRSNLSPVSPLSTKSRLSRWTNVQIPLRMDGLLVLLFLAGNAAVLFTGYEPVFPSPFYPDDPTPLRQIVRYVGDRAGTLALGSTPLVILFAARNSPFAHAGLDFGTLQIYHRWIARVTFTDAGVHAAAYSYLILRRSNWSFWVLFEKTPIIWGWIALVGGLVLCFAAWRRLRQIAYEAFLVGHIVAAISWILFSYLHVAHLHSSGEGAYSLQLTYLAAAAWAFDRVLRLLSLLWNNTFLGRLFCIPPLSSKTRFLTAHGTLLGTSNDFLRLRITPKTPWSRRRGGPGAYVYVSSFTSLAHKGWESHPFSLAWPLGVPDPDDCTDHPTPAESPPVSFTPDPHSQPTQLLELLPSSPVSTPSLAKRTFSSGQSHLFDSFPSSNSFELLIKRYSGFTRALSSSLSIPLSSLPSCETHDHLDLSPEQLHELRIAVEGPYGASTSYAVAKYRQALLVAGGSGLAMITSQLADLGTQMVEKALEPPPKEVKTERVTIVWSVRESETVHLIVPYLTRLYHLFRCSPSFSLKHLDPSPPSHSQPFLNLHIYLTGSLSSLSTANTSITSLNLPPAFLNFTIHTGRPDIGAHIDALQDPELGELIVLSCGPASLCDTAREAVRSRLAGFSLSPVRGRGSGKRESEESAEEDEGESETEQELLVGERRRERRERTRWEACRLIYHEEAVVW